MTTELAKAPIVTLSNFLMSRKNALASVVTGGLTTERAIGVLLACASRTPKLLACTPASIYECLHTASSLGLELGSLLGEAYPVPYKDKATLIIGYKGLVKLARKGGMRAVEARVVREHDKFVLRYGLEPTLEHTPSMEADPGEARWVYAIARLPDGEVQFDVMSAEQVDAIRDRDPRRSDAAGRGESPWATDWEEMAKKTVLRRLAKLLPMKAEHIEALSAEEARDITPQHRGPAVTVEQPKEKPARGTVTMDGPAEPAADAETGEVPGADPFDGLGSEAREIAEAIMAAKTAPEKKALVAKAQAALVDGKISGDERKALLALAGM